MVRHQNLHVCSFSKRTAITETVLFERASKDEVSTHCVLFSKLGALIGTITVKIIYVTVVLHAFL